MENPATRSAAPETYGNRSGQKKQERVPEGHYVSGPLVAVTATGPVYRTTARAVLLPIPVSLALLQELAGRAMDPHKRVSSSQARRVGGELALSAWARTSGHLAATIARADKRNRLAILSEVLRYIRRQGNANGIESVLGTAINAASPWLDQHRMKRVLEFTSKHLSLSRFAAKHAIPIADPTTGTYTVFAPGELAKQDLGRWLDWRALSTDGFGTPSYMGGASFDDSLGSGLLPGRGPDLSGLPGGGRGQGSDDFGNAGGLLPGRGPDLSGLPGGGGGGGRGSEPDDRGLLPGRGPDLSGLGGPGTGYGGDQSSGFGGMFGSGLGLDLGRLGGGANGGPLGFGSNLGQGGASTPNDAWKTLGSSLKSWGSGMVAGGAALFGAGALGAGASAATGNVPGVAIGAGVARLGGAVVVAGAVLAVAGLVIEVVADAEKPDSSTPAPTTTTPTPTQPQPDAPVSVPIVTRPPSPPPEDPHPGDLYPDPDGGGGTGPNRLPVGEGGGGTPNTIWDENGGGGNPNTIWDENGGGGTPTSIWDDNGGGGTPNTTGQYVTVSTLTGRGVLASIAQVGPATFSFR